ncbi:MAG: hypothetical protein IKC67_04090, partial [Odoribacter sp.]|nr:hypothetical protein [Odoribacter sp.]
MKKIFLGLISLAAIAVGCEYEVMEGERFETQKIVPITVNVPSNQSRVAYDGANATFEIGDQIALRVHDIANDENLAAEQTAYTFTCTAVAGDGNATFEGELPAYATNVQIGANYPSTLESYTGEKWCRVKTPIPTSFTQTADGSIVEAYDYLRAEATATSIEEGTEITLTFNHVMAFLDFKITNNTGNAVTLNGVELSCTENLFWNGENSRIHTYATGNDSWIEASNGTAAQIETYLATPVTLAAGESKNIVIASTSNDMSAKALNITVVCAEGEQSFAKPNGPNMGMGSYATSNLSLTSIESIETTNLAEISASVYTEDVNSSAWIHVLDAEVPASVATTLGYADNAALFAALGGDVAYTIKDAYDNKVSTPKADAWFDATGKFDQANGVWGTITQAGGSTGLRVAFFRRDISTVSAAELTFTATFEKDNKVVNLPLRITVADKPVYALQGSTTYNIELPFVAGDQATTLEINNIANITEILGGEATSIDMKNSSDAFQTWTTTDGWFGANGATNWGNNSIVYFKPNLDGTFYAIGMYPTCVGGETASCTYRYYNSATLKSYDVIINVTIETPPAVEYVHQGSTTYNIELPFVAGNQATTIEINNIANITEILGGEATSIDMKNSSDAFQIWTTTDGWFGANGATNWGNNSIVYFKPNLDGTFYEIGMFHTCVGGETASCTYRYYNSATLKSYDVIINVTIET